MRFTTKTVATVLPKPLAMDKDKMENSVVVYHSRREQMMDEFWMSEEGSQTAIVILAFLVGSLLFVIREKK